MSEVRTSPVKAIFLTYEQFIDRSSIARMGLTPGSICRAAEDDAPDFWWYCCPCGCGHVGRLHVGEGEKPIQSPSWAWTGGEAAATLQPSVHHVGHWHGWLRNGIWESC